MNAIAIQSNIHPAYSFAIEREWVWDKKQGVYIDKQTGRRMPKSQLRTLSKDSLVASQDYVATLTTMLENGQIDVDEWYERVDTEIMDEHIRQYAYAIGGVEEFEEEDWEEIAASVNVQLGFFERLKQEIIAGLIVIGTAYLISRVAMYVNSAVSSYYAARKKTAVQAGFSEEVWVIDPTSKNCPDCIEYGESGAQPIGYFPEPGDGSTQCLTNCNCEKYFVKPDTEEELW